MANLLICSTICPLWMTPKSLTNKFVSPLSNTRRGVTTTRAFFNLSDEPEPILKEAIKEPVAFMGGMFAGLLRLDLNEEPLKDWINRTIEASGITEDDFNTQGPEQGPPQQIDIE